MTYLKQVDAALQDQHTPIIIANLSSEEASTLLATTLAIDDYTFDVDDATGFTIGGYLSIFNISANRFYLATILNIATDTITVDSPLDFAFPIGSFVTSGDRNLNVNGSVTPVVFGLRNTEEAIGSTFDITRLMFACTTTGANDLSKFGDITGGLTNGLVLRKKNGTYENIFNVKTNGGLANIMYDLTIYTSGAQGQDGFTGRLTLGGQNKVGVVIRIEPGDDIQVIVQDDLTQLLDLSIIAEGHIVED